MSVILVDFDGTVVKHEFPYVGEAVPNAINVLKELIYNGHKIVLYTMRSRHFLNDAIEWYDNHNIPLHNVKYDDIKFIRNESNKCDGDIVIDDRNLGIPLIKPDNGRPYVDWDKVLDILIEMKLIEES